jgi:hypothetical protein
MTYEIQTNIPLPSSAKGSRGSKYPFARMHIGDSFAVDSGVAATTIRSAVGAFCKTHKNHKFVVREIDGAVRVWRIAKEEV